jgi:hypothetical protein
MTWVRNLGWEDKAKCLTQQNALFFQITGRFAVYIGYLKIATSTITDALSGS